MKTRNSSCDWLVEATFIEQSSVTFREYWARKSYRHVWLRAFEKLKDPKIRKKFQIPLKRKSVVLTTLQTIELNRQEKKSFQSLQSSIINPLGKFYSVWLILMSLSTLYSITVQPYLNAFYDFQFNSNPVYMDMAIELIFILDVAVNFNLAYFNDDGHLVYCRLQIAKNYIKTWLVLDLSSSIPFTFIDLYRGYHTYQIYPGFLRLRSISKLVKGVKLNKLTSLFSFISSIDKILIVQKDLAKFFKFLFTLTIALHISSCLFYLAAKIEGFSNETWVIRYDVLDLDADQKYLMALYWAITTLCTIGYGDIVPYTTLEKVIGVIWILAGVFTLSYSIGYLNSILASSQKANDYKDSVLKFAEEFYMGSKVPKKNINEVKKYITKNVNFEESLDKHKAIKILSYEIRVEMANHVFRGALDNFYFFTSKSINFKATVGILLSYATTQESKVLWTQRERPTSIVFVINGKAKLLFHETSFLFIGSGNYFGDVEVALNKLRIFEAVACEGAEFLVMDEKTIEIIKSNFMHYWDEMKIAASVRVKRLLQNLAEILIVKGMGENTNMEKLKEEIQEMYYKLKKRFVKGDYYQKIMELNDMQLQCSNGIEKIEHIINNLQYY